MTDVEKALRGDHEASKRVTEDGILLPCPFCGCKDIKEGSCYWQVWYFCGECMCESSAKDGEYNARLAWNTRAAVREENERPV